MLRFLHYNGAGEGRDVQKRSVLVVVCDDSVNLVFDRLGLKCFEDIQIKDAQQAFKVMPANPRREYSL